MTGLVKYEAARRALAEATTVDEVKDVLDKTAAMAEYARRAKDGDLIGLATELRMRAEIRLGELLREQKAAGGLNTGARGIGTSEGVRFHGGTAPKLADLGVDKKLSSRSQRLAAEEPAEQEAKIDKAKRFAIAAATGNTEVIKEARAEQSKVKKEKRAAKEQDLASKIAALPQTRYGVILADPEWRFEPYSRETGMDRAADNHYPTSALDVIKARDVPSIAADNCVLFLWGTAPMLPQALEVMAAWGFTYKTNASWDKLVTGTGFWFRNQHEHLLLGTRGDVPAPNPEDVVASIFYAKRGAHSVKPEQVYEVIERYFPNVPKVELNARKARPGWDAWGVEAPPVSHRTTVTGRGRDDLTIPDFLDRNSLVSPALDQTDRSI